MLRVLILGTMFCLMTGCRPRVQAAEPLGRTDAVASEFSAEEKAAIHHEISELEENATEGGAELSPGARNAIVEKVLGEHRARRGAAPAATQTRGFAQKRVSSDSAKGGTKPCDQEPCVPEEQSEGLVPCDPPPCDPGRK